VDVSHGNVTNALLLNPGKLNIAPGTKVGQVLNVSFDMGKSTQKTRLECHANDALQALGRY
jgi:hypothetical protein